MTKDLEVRQRETATALDQGQTVLRGLKAVQRLRVIWLLASLGATGFLGWAMLVGIWANYRDTFSVIGTIAALVSTAVASIFLLKARPEIDEVRYKLHELQAQHRNLAASQEADSLVALRIYRVSALDDVHDLERRASRNRRTANLFQWAIIVGSVSATSLTGAAATNPNTQDWFRWLAAAISAVVSVSAGATGFFKFRERSFGQQQTADAIKKHYKAVELGIGEYEGDDENVALGRFAQNVEALKDEQRKRELQLEESTESRENQKG
ncbi:DUF4231 domain-containing protein [Planotetraspora sp. A-T 1434]|uniref:DUF4231 domain-containing protein n=1 Tax=Planotetraspora sp. A-T 1434 TaxID=2979219 RepID=UPI0021BFB405|nr:DUF4231 domain-containing protein [Planotetraspora sp. A-T 1434]MCT9931814.1 DUF4231 domain-containing protein [Planotetraspora sp. A-T 1434]